MNRPEKLAPLRQAETGERWRLLLAVLDTLRGPEGCPWDREQTSHSLMPYLLEEVYEVIESVESNDHTHLQEELGDLLLHVIFQCKIAEEEGQFNVDDCLEGITEKLVRRHPHVFEDESADGAFHAKKNWEKSKQEEKGRTSRLDGVPRKLPALTRARRIQEKASYVGFDWGEPGPVWAKIHEELNELEQAITQENPDELEEELGDVLFSLVNLSRFLKVDPERALRSTISKFEYRFQQVEHSLVRQGKSIDDASLEEMDALWNEIKRRGKQE